MSTLMIQPLHFVVYTHTKKAGISYLSISLAVLLILIKRLKQLNINQQIKI